MRRAAALLLLVVACGKRDVGPGRAERTIRFVGWGAPEERGAFRDVVAAFEAEHPSVRVEYTQVPGVGYDYLNKLRLMIVAGIAPDVFYVPDGAFGELVRSGTLLDLDSRVSREELDEMWPTAVDRFRFDGTRLHAGHVYALPKDIGPTVMFYDADRFRARGVPLPDPVVPMTWSEAVATWRALATEEGGVRRYGTTGYPFETAVWMAGQEVLSPDRRRWAMRTAAAEDAVQWCADLALREGVAPDPTRSGAEGAGGRELFEARLAATHIDGRWMVPRFRTLAFDWDVAPIPVHDRSRAVAWSGSVGLAVSAGSRHPDEAFAFVAFAAGPRGQARLVRTGLQLPNQRALATTDAFLQPGERPAHADVFVRAVAGSRPSSITEVASPRWFDLMGVFLDEVWRGERTARALFPEIAPRIDAALAASDARAR